MTTILTLEIDPPSQAHFDELRTTHYPAHLNRIDAHLTLFHALPDTESVWASLQETSAKIGRFTVQVKGLMSLGRGVAYAVESPELLALHKRLASANEQYLIPQDRQRFRPHVVVQNKATSAESKLLLAQLSATFSPWQIEAQGLDWWNYLNGPWELRERFRFSG